MFEETPTLDLEDSREADSEEFAESEAFDPVGTLTLIGIYFVILVAMWILMYFVEFLGRGPTVVG